MPPVESTCSTSTQLQMTSLKKKKKRPKVKILLKSSDLLMCKMLYNAVRTKHIFKAKAARGAPRATSQEEESLWAPLIPQRETGVT